MAIPTLSAPVLLAIQSAADSGEVLQVTLQDGTTLWVPKDASNNDYLNVQAWAQENNIDL